jgi:hypothetical protein
MPAITKLNDPDVIYNVLQSTLDALVVRLTDCGLAVPARRFVGFSEPPQDCCPDLVIWGDNIGPDDLSLGQGMTKGYFTCNNSWSMDVHIRIGLCFVDVDADSNPLSASETAALSAAMYQYWHCLYMQFVCEQASNPTITELSECDGFTVQPSTSYASGGCGGFEFVMRVPLEN